jgi:hypothetical protein
MTSNNKSATSAMTVVSLALAAILLGALGGCSKSDDEKLKEDVAAIRAMKEKELAEQEAKKKAFKERTERAAAGIGAAWGTESAASAPKAASK